VRLLAVQQNLSTWLMSESATIAAGFGDGARAGLAVYLNNYRAQLLASLSASHPVLRTWMGDTAFEAAAAKHIDNVPPHSWTLDAYGLDFSETLSELHASDPEIGELARLERELEAAFVGPDSAPLDPASLPGIDWDAAIIQLVPTFRLLSVKTNAAAIWSAITDHETPPPAACLSEPATVAIWRDEFAPRFRVLTADEATVLRQLRAGQTFGAICSALVERQGQERGAAAAGSVLGQSLADHMVRRIGPQ
jgi:putative DNA-binding protein